MSQYEIPESEPPASGRRPKAGSQELDKSGNINSMYEMGAPVDEGRITSKADLIIQKPIINTTTFSSSPTEDPQQKEGHRDFKDVLVSPKKDSERKLTKPNQQSESLHQNQHSDSPFYCEPSIEASLSVHEPLAPDPINDIQPKSRLHGSPSESVSSSVVVTPQQQHSERFGSIGEINRGSVDSAVHVEASDFKIAKGFIPKQPLSTNLATTVVLVDDVCPLDTGAPTSASTALPPAASAEHMQSYTSGTNISPTSSAQKSNLGLLPSAFGFAASLLPLARTESASSVDSTTSTDRSSSSTGTQDKPLTSPTANVRHRRQSSDSSDTSSIVSTSSSKGIVDNIPALGSLGPSSWRSLTTFLTSRTSAAPIQESPTTPTPGKNQRAAARNILQVGEETPSTSFLLHHVTSASATADRRRSLELGGPQMLRDGFERVKAEMVSAAKELRDKERQKRDSARSDATPAASDADGTNEVAGSVPTDLASQEGGKSDRHSLDADGIDWSFWGAVMGDYELVARTRPKELSKAIQEGVPAVVRGTIWQLMSVSKSITLEATYSALLKLPSPHEKAIQKDLSRTFPNHAYFKKGNGVGQENLFNVIKAYSLYDQDVGYTQGLAFIVAALLLNMPDEEAFCVLVRLMQSYGLRSHYIADMPGLQLRMYQFDRLLEELSPVLHLHFVRAGVKSSMYASQWFMTLFSYRFPLSLVYRTFDIVFAEGLEAVFRFSMALMRKNEMKLLQLDFEGILKFLSVDIFECYKNTASIGENDTESGSESASETEWLTNEFVRDAYAVQLTPFMLDSFAGEWEEHLRSQNAHAMELDTLRNANRSLRDQVKRMENAFSTMNNEHVEIVKQLVQSRIEKEELEAELIRYKLMCADLAHEQQNSMSRQSRMASIASLQPNH